MSVMFPDIEAAIDIPIGQVCACVCVGVCRLGCLCVCMCVGVGTCVVHIQVTLVLLGH